MRDFKAVFITVIFFSGFLCLSVPEAISQYEYGVDYKVTDEARDSAGNTVVNAGTEEVTVDDEEKSDIEEDRVEGGEDSGESEDGEKVKEDEEKPKEESKYLYERRGRLPPVMR